MALTYGSRGNDVLEYQKKMKAAGIDPGPLDGIWGDKTEKAHKAYQATISQAANQVSSGGVDTSGLWGLGDATKRMGGSFNGTELNGVKVGTNGLKQVGDDLFGTPDQILGLLATAKAPEYENPMFDKYEISGLVQKILNPEKFTWDKNTDPIYQSLLKSATANGDKAFNDNIAGLTSLTGGRLNSWAAGQASQARSSQIAQADEQIPALYQLAYSMYQDKQNQLMNSLNALLGIDETYYNRNRDAYGDFKNNVATALNLEDQKYQRNIDQRNYDRDVFESDRNYNRNVYESDRAYNYNVEQAKSAQEQAKAAQQKETYTPQQYAAYNKLYAGLLQNDMSPTEDLKHITSLRPGYLIDMLGENLYNKLLDDLRTAAGKEKAPDPEVKSPMVNSPYYSAGINLMKQMLSMKVTDDYGDSIPKYTEEQISQAMYEWIKNQPLSPEEKAELANALGI